MPAKRARGASRQPAATASSTSAAAKGAATSSVLVHRCRFVDQVPDPVESLQYDPSCSRLAVLRANSDIELWSLSEGGWFREAYVPGVPDTPVRRLALGSRTASHPDGRLFSCGLHGVVTEWDLARLSPLDNYDSLGGAAWSLALHAGSARLAAGCEDGGVTVFGVVEEGLENVYRLPARGGRVLSLAFSSSGGQLVAGGADGSVRLWALGGGGAARHTWRHSCQFVLESEGRKRPPLVWDVLLLPDSLVVTADSSGRVCFYDGRHGTLVNRFRSHEADVLALAATGDGSHVFASGVDHKVSLFTPQPEELKPHQQPLAIFNLAAPRPPRQYLLNCSRRPHTHDVRALLVIEPPSSSSSFSAPAPAAAAAAVAAPAAAAGAAPVPAPLGGGGGSWLTPQLVSAGLDTQLVLLSLDGFERCSPSKLLPPPLPSSCSVAPQARLLAAHGVSEVRLWQLPLAHAGPPAGERGGAPPPPPEPQQLLLLKPSGLSRHLFCASASSDGRWLLASDTSPRLYRIGLESHGAGAGAAPEVTRVPLPEGAAAAVCAAFSADSRLLLLGTTLGTLQALPLDAATDAPPCIHTLRPPLDEFAGADTGDAVADGTLAAVLRLSLSSDLQWAAAADARRRVSIYSLDALAFHGAMPRLSSPPAALAFVPGTPLLAVATVDKRQNCVSAHEIAREFTGLHTRVGGQAAPHLRRRRTAPHPRRLRRRKRAVAACPRPHRGGPPYRL